MRLFLLAVITLGMIAHADEVYYRTGYVMKNVQVADSTATHYLVKTNTRNRNVPRENVLRIVFAPFNLEEPTISEVFSDSLAALNDKSNTLPRESISKSFTKSLNDSLYREGLKKFTAQGGKEYPNIMWLNVTALGTLYAWANFKAAGIDGIGSSARTQAIAFGTISATVSIVSLTYALKSVEIKTDGRSISATITLP